MEHNPYLSVTISTCRPQGIERVAAMRLPQVDGVEYVVSWQESADAPVPPELAERPDVRIFRLNGLGLSVNRNNAIIHARGQVVMIGDDDLIYHPEALRQVMEIFREDDELHYASFRYDGPDAKTYPTESININPRPSHFHQTSFEVAFRLCPATETLRYSDQFGIGAKRFTAGEDSVLAIQARNMGLKCRFYPVTTVTHPGMSTGFRKVTDPGVTRTKGAVITLEHPVSFLLRLPLAAWRDMRAGRAGFLTSLRNLFTGAAMILADRPLWHSIRHPQRNSPR